VKVRYQADENLDQAIVSGVLRREPSIDFRTPQNAGLLGADDWTVLGRCASEGRILVTYDVRTMPAHFAGFITQQPSSGVLVATRNLRLAEVIESLLPASLSEPCEVASERCENRCRRQERAVDSHPGRSTGTPHGMTPLNNDHMMQRHAKRAGIKTRIGNHSMRATGITDYLKSEGSLSKARKMANHADTGTTQLYDRRSEVKAKRSRPSPTCSKDRLCR
jgi:Domain of unknown function (DUF5615)